MQVLLLIIIGKNLLSLNAMLLLFKEIESNIDRNGLARNKTNEPIKREEKENCFRSRV